jgi:hypothetical protein
MPVFDAVYLIVWEKIERARECLPSLTYSVASSLERRTYAASQCRPSILRRTVRLLFRVPQDCAQEFERLYLGQDVTQHAEQRGQ